MKTILLAALVSTLPALAAAAERPAGLAAAEALARAALGPECTMNDMAEVPMAGPDDDGFGHFFYRFTYRAARQSADEPEIEAELYQLFCVAGAYNVRHAFVLKTSDEEGLRLLAFARPELDYAYADEEMTTLKAPPGVKGFGAALQLVNSRFDERTLTVTSVGAWRGLGDAWDSGTWTFRDGGFVLTRFEVDPTYDGSPADGASGHVVYDAAR